MSFQERLLISNAVFLTGFIAVKVWDLRAGKDHLGEWARIHHRFSIRNRRKLFRPGEPDSAADGLDYSPRSSLGLIIQGKALIWEFMWLTLTLAPVELPAFALQARAEAAKGKVADDPQYYLVSGIVFSYLILMIVIRVVEAIHFGRRAASAD